MENNIVFGKTFGLQSIFSAKKPLGLEYGKKLNNNNTAYYAKKGEPMYMKEMDADEDGVVTIDEFKDYCQANNISPKEMLRMLEMGNAYRTMQAQKKASNKIESSQKSDDSDDEAVYAKKGDAKYDEAMDANSDDKITYKEYVEYCRENAKPQDQKAGTKAEKTENGGLKTTSIGKAVSAYSQAESDVPKGKIESVG